MQFAELAEAFVLKRFEDQLTWEAIQKKAKNDCIKTASRGHSENKPETLKYFNSSTTQWLWLSQDFSEFQDQITGTSLVAQWLRICLPIQGTRVWVLVWEDPRRCGATKPMCHHYWACALEPTSHNYWARVSQLLKPTCLEPVLRNKRSHRDKKPAHCNEE